jgi:hypothetical protein
MTNVTDKAKTIDELHHIQILDHGFDRSCDKSSYYKPSCLIVAPVRIEIGEFEVGKEPMTIA